MLDSLDIKNYRNLKELRINSLGRVNLFTGKNNTGKSSILEAIAIYATKGDLGIIYQLLGERGENFRQSEANKNPTETNVKVLSSLFTDRLVGFNKIDAISIGTIEETLFGKEKSSEKSISLRFVKYFDEIISQVEVEGNISTRRKRIVAENDTDGKLGDYKLGLEIRASNSYIIRSLEEERPFNRLGFRGIGNNENFQFIRTRNIDSETNGKLWDNITLSEKEKYVIEALKIIESRTERIAFVGETPRERAAVIKLSNNSNILPLRSMGDGINRILTIILALVNSDNGFLLIDEFENGLHHTVQEQLWDIIFKLAQQLNVQIFVTTHSEDCISGFQNILNSPTNSLDGKLIRLDNENGVIKQVEFNAQELRIANNNDIEIR
jgi:AAA15 family ATPase/GTPase